MDSKKKRIMQESLKLFSEKGFHATSIQEISAQSEISKGGFYLHFTSKDDLLIEIYRYYTHTLIDKIEEIKQTTPDPRAQFTKQMEAVLQLFKNHREYIMVQFQDQVHLGEKMNQLIFDLHKQNFEWMQEQLLCIYGERISPYIVDLIIQLEGMMSKYMEWSIFHYIEFEPSKLASYLMRQVDVLAEHVCREMSAPIFTLKDLGKFRTDKEQDALAGLKQAINSSSGTERQKMGEAFQVLEEELNKPAPKQIIIQSMLAHLESYPAIYTAVQLFKDKRGDN